MGVGKANQRLCGKRRGWDSGGSNPRVVGRVGARNGGVHEVEVKAEQDDSH